MPRFASPTDMATLLGFNDELMREVISQQIGYYKVLLKSATNLYGESLNKQYETPRILIAQVMASNQQSRMQNGLIDQERDITIYFLQAHLEESGVYIESGDVFEWFGQYYEARTIVRNSLPFDLDPRYSLDVANDGYGASWNVIVSAVLTSKQKLGL